MTDTAKLMIEAMSDSKSIVMRAANRNRLARALRALHAAGPSEGMVREGESAASFGIGKPTDDEALPRVWKSMLAQLIAEIGQAK